MNPHADSSHRPPDAAVVDRFTAILAGRGVRVTLRRQRGSDIDAACGQLASRPLTSVPSEPGRGSPAA
ncbi:MAG: hypothetical protein GWN99_07360 [Gemmatimonadetes bacterium]|nr:hypothetical protein [Gemmatimonadota bacterium]